MRSLGQTHRRQINIFDVYGQTTRINDVKFLLVYRLNVKVSTYQSLYMRNKGSKFVYEVTIILLLLSPMASATKKMKRKTMYSDEYRDTYACVKKCSSNVGDYKYKFHCTICNLDPSCASGGIRDVKHHVETPSHVRNNSQLQKNVRMNRFFTKVVPEGDSIDPSIRAEAKLAMLIVQHNTFFNISDHV